LPSNQKYEFHLIDINHGLNVFPSALTEIEKVIGQQTLFDKIKAYEYDSYDYKIELEQIQDSLKKDVSIYQNIWGEKWYNRIVEIVDIEIRSSEYRTTTDEYSQDTIRESTMISIINKRLKDYPNKKIILNVGMWHAQKKRMMGPINSTLGEYFFNIYKSDYFSISFIGLNGVKIESITDNIAYSFDLLENTDYDDVTHIIGTKSSSKDSYIVLYDPIFKNDLKITYSYSKYYNTQQFVKPANQYNAILIYTEISVMESINEF